MKQTFTVQENEQTTKAFKRITEELVKLGVTHIKTLADLTTEIEDDPDFFDVYEHELNNGGMTMGILIFAENTATYKRPAGATEDITICVEVSIFADKITRLTVENEFGKYSEVKF